MSDTAALVAVVADTLQTWSRNGGPPTGHLSAEDDPPVVARRLLLRVLQLHDSCDPAPERTLRQALKHVSDDDRRRLCALLAGWCECTDLADVLIDSKRKRRLPKSVRGLIP